jgi:hypothetical protein
MSPSATFSQSLTSALALTALAFTMVATSASAQSMSTTIRPLLEKAMTQGEARIVLDGKIAAKFREQFGRDGPVVANAKVIEDLGVKGCKRLLVNIEMLGASIEDANGKAYPARINMPVNFCPDGTIPSQASYAAKKPAVILPSQPLVAPSAAVPPNPWAPTGEAGRP